MSHVSNCLQMLMILNSKGLVKSKELAEILEVKDRMIRKYKMDLEMAGIYIGTKPGRYGGYYLEQKSVLPITEFQKREMAALDLAYEYIQNLKYFPEKEGFKMLYHHISSMSMYKEEIEQYLYFIQKSKPRDTLTKDNELFLQLRSAIIGKEKVMIRYQDHKGEVDTRKIRPYGLINYDSNWYCRAFCEKRQAQRTFKLLRIQSLQSTNESFEPDPDFNIREDKMGICDDEYDVDLLIYPPFSHTITEAVWGENQQITKNHDESVTFKAKMFGRLSIVRWILSMGGSVKVLGPKEIQQAVKEELKKTLDYY